MKKKQHQHRETDHETRISEDDHLSLRLWLRLLTCSSLVESKLRGMLREEFQTTLPRFDFLAQLERTPEGLTMGELSKRMMVSCGNVSGIANQLEQESLISRTAVPDNRRTFIVKLTPRGRRYFKKLARKHEEWVIQLMGHMNQKEMNALMELLIKLKTGLKDNISG